jgi:hypothetical protein
VCSENSGNGLVSSSILYGHAEFNLAGCSYALFCDEAGLCNSVLLVLEFHCFVKRQG